MTIQALLFDLDGVLFDGREFHRKQFLEAANSFIVTDPITLLYHDKHLDGLSTYQKLDLLIAQGLLSANHREAVFRLKQTLTEQNLPAALQLNQRLLDLLRKLKQTYKLACVSNSTRKTIDTCLTGLLGDCCLFDCIVSNEENTENKPSPLPYLNAFQKLGVQPTECLIFEDSVFGRTSAYASGASVCPIVDPLDLTLEKVLEALATPKSRQHMNVVVPMAGLGSRFQKVGYTVPKPFITVLGKPMIQWVIENVRPSLETYGKSSVELNIDVTYHFILQKSHLEAYQFSELCRSLGINFTLTPIDYITEGPACTVLLVKDKINTGDPLIIVNSDQFLEWNQNEFYRALLNPTYGGVISVFENNNSADTKWSFAKEDQQGLVTEVAEKKYISQWATTGIYGWSTGSSFVECAEQMIAKNIRVNNEFYVCPVYMELLQKGQLLRNLRCKKIWGLGVPEDLEIFLAHYPENGKA